LVAFAADASTKAHHTVEWHRADTQGNLSQQ
jgi:hypothetical protein